MKTHKYLSFSKNCKLVDLFKSDMINGVPPDIISMKKLLKKDILMSNNYVFIADELLSIDTITLLD